MGNKLPSVASVTLNLTNGSTITLPRAGIIPDLFVSQEGVIFRLIRESVYPQGKQMVLKYRKNSLMVKHLVADAWMPGWEETKNFHDRARIEAIDGDESNVRADNLRVTTSPSRGRPRDSKVYRLIRAAAAYHQVPNEKMIAEELDLTPSEVLAAVKTYG